MAEQALELEGVPSVEKFGYIPATVPCASLSLKAPDTSKLKKFELREAFWSDKDRRVN
ncbi:MAG: hypothetical protein O6913_02315 [Chloroflexi bacterium]|nr:hypothetical protein [Chloroflexota bacterium]MCZ6706984.1 hypothetical protein [Chloroflexota bacterium]